MAGRRPNPTTFRKGQSGNPHGCPTWVREMRALAAEHSPRAIAVLAELMEKSDKDEVRVRAAEALLDRAGLKPFATEPEKLEVTSRDSGDAIAKLSHLVARRIAGAGTSGGTGEPVSG